MQFKTHSNMIFEIIVNINTNYTSSRNSDNYLKQSFKIIIEFKTAEYLYLS